jgi:hypothetical protein
MIEDALFQLPVDFHCISEFNCERRYDQEACGDRHRADLIRSLDIVQFRQAKLRWSLRDGYFGATSVTVCRVAHLGRGKSWP